MADTTIIDDQFVEDLQTELENLNQDTVMDSGVLDGFLVASLLNPASPSFEAVLPYIFDEKGDPAKIPEGKNRLIELIKTRFTQLESAFQAGNGLDPIIYPVTDDQGEVIESGDDIHDSIEPWAAGFATGLYFWPETSMEDEAVQEHVARIICHCDPEYLKDAFPEGYEHLLEIRKKNNTLQDALYHLVESTFELRKAFRPNVPARNESPKIGRNDPCPCGSGKKYKQCCGKK